MIRDEDDDHQQVHEGMNQNGVELLLVEAKAVHFGHELGLSVELQRNLLLLLQVDGHVKVYKGKSNGLKLDSLESVLRDLLESGIQLGSDNLVGVELPHKGGQDFLEV